MQCGKLATEDGGEWDWVFKEFFMSVFNDLLRLYRKNASITPMEDFCTEALAGVINSDKIILQRFAQTVLNLPSDESYVLKTQQSYFNSDSKQSIIDIVLESETVICFLEMKVHAREGYNQLKNYERQLKEIEQKKSKKGLLRYCSLYHDKKDNFISKDHFEQLRWANIASFLRNYTSSNELVNEFYNFLMENKMGGNQRFTYEDLIGLKVYADIAAKVNDVFNIVQEDLTNNFGKLSGGITNSSQITRHGRLAIFCTDVIGNTWSEVLVSFDFNRNTPGEGPVVAVQLFIKDDNSSFKDVKIAGKGFDKGNFEVDPEVNGGRIRFEKPLASFLEEEHQISEISSWIRDHIQIISDFKKLNPNLEWKIVKDKS